MIQSLRSRHPSSLMTLAVALSLVALGVGWAATFRRTPSLTVATVKFNAPMATRAPAGTSLYTGPSTALKPAPSSPMTEVGRRVQFLTAWHMVARHYIYPDYRGVDWDAVRSEFEPHIRAAHDEATFHRLMAGMIARLGDRHSRYVTPAQARADDALADGSLSYVGIGISTLTLPDALVIETVYDGSPAAMAGLQRRDRIVAVNGHPWTNECAAQCEIRGLDGTQVQLTVRSPGQPVREMIVERRRLVASLGPSSSRLPQDPSIGYLRIPSFHPTDMPSQVERELRSLLHAGPLAGLVIDLRANGGGRHAVLNDILGHFVSGEVGLFYTRKRSVALTIAKNALHDQLASAQIVVLVDHRTASAAEIMAAVLQHTGRARVVGSRSAGNVEVIYPYTFADGSRLWLAREGFRLPNGDILDERGVAPDAELDVDWTRYAEYDDPHITRAIGLLMDSFGCAEPGVVR